MSNFVETSIPWIGKVPTDWDIKPLFSVATENKTKNKERNENVLSLSYGRIIRRDLSKNFGLLPENFNGYQVVDTGYIIIRSTDLQNDKKSLRVGLVKENGVITSAYIGLSPSNTIHPEYLFYYLNMCDLKKVFYSLGGGLRQSLRFEEFKRFPVVVPSIEEQKLISRYLDKKTSQIDSLVEKIQKKIEILKEQRTSLINQYVTKGLDPNVEMKDSGVEWIGEIPKHWEVIRLKNISQVSLSSVDRHEHDDELKVSICHYPDVYKNEYITTQTDLPSGTCSESEFLKFALRDGDVLLTKDSESPDDIGIPTLVRGSLENTVCGYHLGVIRSSSGKTHSNYLYRFIESKSAKDYFFTKSSGITRFGLGKGSIENLTIPLPPQGEQIEIAKKIDCISDKQSKISENLLVKITLLKEYRQSLISSVVTGKVRVTEDMI